MDVAAARRPESVANGDHLRDDASNLAAFLMVLSGDGNALAELEKDARDLVPGLEGIHLEHVSSGEQEAVVVELEERGLRDRTRIAEASYGTVRALALLALLHDPHPPALTCVEEFNHGLHPYAFDLLVDRLREASARTQFLIATHSPALVNRLHADELIVCEREPQTGASRIPAVASERVRRMEQAADGQLGLGELWFSGALGGVPDE